jgi:VCBS repeat-containing protein
MGTGGAWTYTASSANDAFVSSTVYTDTFTVHAADSTAKNITVNITGTNDAAVISGTSTYSLTETNAALTSSGTLTSTDVDGTTNLFTAETVSGTYGSLVMATTGAWAYTAASAYDSLVAGAVVTDTFSVHAADGTASSITVSITGSNDSPVMASSTASITLDQGATSQTLTTVSATDADLVGSLTYSISRQNGDASADYFTVNASTGAVTFTSAGAIATAVDATDTNGDGVMDTPYVIHVIATDDKGAYATETITVNVDMAVSSSGLSASLPGTTSNWSFAPQTTTSGDSTVSDGFKMTSTTTSSVYINLPSTVTSLVFADDSSNTLTLSNDASTGTVTDTSTSNHNFTMTTGVTENTLLQVKAATTQTITGVTDTTTDPDLGTSTNYRDDTLQITDAAFSSSTFSMSGSTLQITMSGSGAVKTLSEVETVKFTDHTVRIVGASGYASFLEAITSGNTSHAAVNDYVYGSSSSGYTPTNADLTHLTLVSGTTDFYTYNG